VDNGTNWYTVTAFRQLALNTNSSLRKGERVVVSGRLRMRDWTAGERAGTSIEIDADAIGHDLSWGTASFTRGMSSRAADAATRLERQAGPADETGADGTGEAGASAAGWGGFGSGGLGSGGFVSGRFDAAAPLVEGWPTAVPGVPDLAARAVESADTDSDTDADTADTGADEEAQADADAAASMTVPF
jgi:single-strand DNA-binding protein